jgi:hypothetical protein
MLTPHFNDSPSTSLTDEQRRARHERSARRAAITNRIRFREQAEVSAAPLPTPRRAVCDPLALADHLAARKVSEIEKDEQEWRQRIDRELQREREFFQKFGTEPPKWIPRRWRELERLGRWPLT